MHSNLIFEMLKCFFGIACFQISASLPRTCRRQWQKSQWLENYPQRRSSTLRNNPAKKRARRWDRPLPTITHPSLNHVSTRVPSLCTEASGCRRGPGSRTWALRLPSLSRSSLHSNQTETGFQTLGTVATWRHSREPSEISGPLTWVWTRSHSFFTSVEFAKPVLAVLKPSLRSFSTIAPIWTGSRDVQVGHMV